MIGYLNELQDSGFISYFHFTVHVHMKTQI